MTQKQVDRFVANRETYSVHENYSVVLNQTNIGKNNNKFYIMQLLSGNNKYYVSTRWGRVGDVGTSKLDDFTNVASAISEFKKKFKAKTGNKWEEEFFAEEGKYIIVDVEEDSGNATNTNNDSKEMEEPPMGKLSENQIVKGQDILKLIETEINKNNVEKSIYEVLSSKFYSLIPTVCGRKRPPVISNNELLQQKEELLKFYLRMGFEEKEAIDIVLTPISGIMKLIMKNTLKEAIGKYANDYDVKQSVQKGKLLAEKNAGNPIKKMNEELYGSILLYTSNAIYKELNRVLRCENRREIKKYFDYLRMFFEALDSLPKVETTLWRGMKGDFYEQYNKVGTQVTWWGVSSCTSEKSVAEGFANSCGDESAVIQIDAKMAVDISDLSFYLSEKESILAPGTRFEIVSCKRNGKKSFIHLKEIGRVID